ncbi:MAG TPA: hypothetical protein VMW75_07390 [Thermoanaerobaculia bacterium]|nr:hypothetical protein [Thermoanaerobaculia bacterium]
MKFRFFAVLMLATCMLTALVPHTVLAQSCGTNLSCTTSGDAFTVSNSAGAAMFGSTSLTSGNASAIHAQDGSGGVCTAAFSAPSTGLRGESYSYIGVEGFTTSGTAGVAGYQIASLCQQGTGWIVNGMLAARVSGHNYGVYSNGDSGVKGNLTVTGNASITGTLTVTGTKSFAEPHPTDAAKEILYVALEGPEAGTYFRGTGRTVRGVAVIEVPESFRLVSDESGLTVVATPVGKLVTMAVIKKSLDRIVVQSSEDVEFDYMVNGVRRSFKNFEAIVPNLHFVPDGPDDRQFFTLPAESQRRLVQTGVYTPDGRVNLLKAHEMGWDQAWGQEKTALDEKLPANR